MRRLPGGDASATPGRERGLLLVAEFPHAHRAGRGGSPPPAAPATYRPAGSWAARRKLQSSGRSSEAARRLPSRSQSSARTSALPYEPISTSRPPATEDRDGGRRRDIPLKPCPGGSFGVTLSVYGTRLFPPRRADPQLEPPGRQLGLKRARPHLDGRLGRSGRDHVGLHLRPELDPPPVRRQTARPARHRGHAAVRPRGAQPEVLHLAVERERVRAWPRKRSGASALESSVTRRVGTRC